MNNHSRAYVVLAWDLELHRFLPTLTHDTAALPMVAEGVALQHAEAFVCAWDGDRLASLGEWYAAGRHAGTRAEDRRELRIKRAHAEWSAAVYLAAIGVAPFEETARLADEHKRIVGEVYAERSAEGAVAA